MKVLKRGEFNFRRGYIVYPRLVVVVGVKLEDRINFMSVVWNSPLSFDPPLYGVSIAPKRYTHDMLLTAMEFSISFFPYEMAEVVEKFGTVSGREVDKVKEFGVELLEPAALDVPIPAGAYAVLECEYFDHKLYGDHTWIVGEIQAIHYDERVTGSRYNMPVLDFDRARPVLYGGSGEYITVDPRSIRKLR